MQVKYALEKLTSGKDKEFNSKQTRERWQKKGKASGKSQGNKLQRNNIQVIRTEEKWGDG